MDQRTTVGNQHPTCKTVLEKRKNSIRGTQTDQDQQKDENLREMFQRLMSLPVEEATQALTRPSQRQTESRSHQETNRHSSPALSIPPLLEPEPSLLSCEVCVSVS